VQTVSHKDEPRFIINTHTFHNAMSLRKVLPAHLTEPKHYYPNCHERHREIAKELIVTLKEKRAETTRKAAETRLRNKAAKEAQKAATNRGAITLAPVASGSEAVIILDANRMDVDSGSTNFQVESTLIGGCDPEASRVNKWP
jgi:hypothetical protein